jgi:perosamine synthetase
MINQNLELAINGGKPAIPGDQVFKAYNTIGAEEKDAACRVIDSGILSGFVASWGEDFLGGAEVQSFEREWERAFDVKHAISTNSWTSGLFTMIGAIGIEPGDEVIVSPWTMSATATAIIMWGGIPVFSDIEKDFFCIDPDKVEALITPATKAILTVDIFGQSSDIGRLQSICDRHSLKLLSDTAQAPGSTHKGKKTGTLCDIGGFSLNYHKHIHTGEGGVLVTDDDVLALRMRLIRNHAECSVLKSGIKDISNMVGGNYRMCEIEAAMGKCQLKKLEASIKDRQRVAESFSMHLSTLRGIQLPQIRDNNTHVFYTFPIILKDDDLIIKSTEIYNALIAEGILGLGKGYVNLIELPMYQQKIAFGRNGYPWNLQKGSATNYSLDACPTAAHYHNNALLNLEICLFAYPENDIELVASAFHKVWRKIESLG